MVGCRRSRGPRVRLHHECVPLHYHKPPGASGNDSDSSDDNVSHYRVKYKAPTQLDDDEQRPHVRFADTYDIEPSVSTAQTEANDTEEGFDDTGPEPTAADIQRAASVEEDTDFVVPEPGTIPVDRVQSFDDSSEDGEDEESSSGEEYITEEHG